MQTKTGGCSVRCLSGEIESTVSVEAAVSAAILEGSQAARLHLQLDIPHRYERQRSA